MTYFSKALKQVNSINWSEIGNSGVKEDSYLMAEFLRRMAIFVSENSVEPSNPMFIDIAKVLGYTGEIDTEVIYSEETKAFLDGNMHLRTLIKSYLKLCEFADIDDQVYVYTDVYMPVIRLLERGVGVFFRSGFFELVNVASVPVYKWIERTNMEPINISEI